MIQRIERILYFLIIIFLPTQIGKHFWPRFSFVDGIRVDYLSPTLFCTDILIIFLFSAFLIRVFKQKQFFRDILPAGNGLGFVVVVLGTLVVSTMFSKFPLSSLYEDLKFTEFLFLGLYTTKILKKSDIQLIFFIFSVDALIVSGIAFIQFFRQSSIGGLLYFLGERTFNASTIGIANMSINGALIMRPYSIFPHPNVLAFYLFVCGLFSLQRILYEKEKKLRLFFILSLIVSSLGIFITFSRLTIFLYLVSFLAVLRKRLSKKITIGLVAAGLSILLFVPIFFYRFFSFFQIVRSLSFRLDLAGIAVSIFFQHPLFGVGLNNFYNSETPYQRTITPTLLQPVHNVFLLFLSELGILGFLLFCYFLFHTFQFLREKVLKVRNQQNRFYQTTLFVLFFVMVVISLSDHFFVTVQQGQLLSSVLFGLFWRRKGVI